MSENETQNLPTFTSKEVVRLRHQAERMELVPGEDFEETMYTIRTTGKKVPVLRLTEAGEQKRQQIKDQIFGEAVPRAEVPLGNNYDFSSDGQDQVLQMDGLLALSLIRRRTGGYVCSFTDDFSKLSSEQYQARVMKVNPDSQTARVMFDHWPGEYINHDFVLERANLTAINEPISIGPECVINLQTLRDGKPHEDLIGWAKNLIRRNVLGKS